MDHTLDTNHRTAARPWWPLLVAGGLLATVAAQAQTTATKQPCADGRASVVSPPVTQPRLASPQPAAPGAVAPTVPLVTPVLPPAAVAITGRNVGLVTVGQGGQRSGAYRQSGPKQWAELNEAGAVVSRFEETQRDDGSVYLLDRLRGVSLQLDLLTRKVMYSDTHSPSRPLYDVLAVGR